MRRRDFLIRLGLVAAGVSGAWWLRDNVLWARPDVAFGPDGSSGWLPYDEPRASVPTVQITVAGQPVRALIDSGAQYSVIDRGLFETLGISNTFDLPLVAYGVGGQPQLGKGTTLDIQVGEMRLTGLRTAILALGPLAMREGLSAPLILGQDMLRSVVIEIETGERRVRMVAPDRHVLPDDVGPVAVRRSGNALVTDVTVEGSVIEAVVDTGASALLALSGEAAGGAGLLDGRAQRRGSSIVLGGAIASRLVEARTVTFGDVLFEAVELPIYADVVLPGFPDALLGMEAFEGQTLVMNTSAGTLHVTRTTDLTVGPQGDQGRT
ncbi:aspartyl protease family protein [Brevundimonas variabilis]|uniref:Putative aspartyl protease n=1 Tax=Brevundimonas variabilis TaxID=74312 RepID=A0A7W9CJD1_9CAUL|nr:aspartyl protease family protein [Brevundimonas variabilis]MBB5746760.1 putative aspartyl protease [Brevundimonas variabilis]